MVAAQPMAVPVMVVMCVVVVVGMKPGVYGMLAVRVIMIMIMGMVVMMRHGQLRTDNATDGPAFLMAAKPAHDGEETHGRPAAKRVGLRTSRLRVATTSCVTSTRGGLLLMWTL